ncbi:MAG: ATP-dependent helicase HepA [Pseudomonadales bacterium]|jgi:ATP-dependent helicase HepA
MSFVVGQRWISHTESALGLGIIAEVAGRLVTVSFPAAEEERTYAIDNAPLGRVTYKVGEEIMTMDDESLAIIRVDDHNGLLVYHGMTTDGEGKGISELELNCFVQFTSPQQCLISGQFGNNKAFQLRVDTINHMHNLQQSNVLGLLGSRTSLLPHQVYIANEVAKRFAPRVLLADEVGLGKTIEAGMIIHQQLHTNRANRVLIVVPDTLVHQWLVEMMRRFNLHFSIFDEQRIQSLEINEGDEMLDEYDQRVEAVAENPFESEQLILCTLSLLTENEKYQQYANDAQWDLLVVDEAHHLEWTPSENSIEYQCVESLAKTSAGVLLLTATPEQMGIEGHFARLRLLDPSRFHDLDVFKTEEQGYEELNSLVQKLLADDCDEEALFDELATYLGDDLPVTDGGLDKNAIINQLLDRHGTGRILFRNTRAAIPNFPKRVVHSYPLPAPPEYELAGLDALYPEQHVPEVQWIVDDPRVDWLKTTLKGLKGKKVLVICASADTAVGLEHHLQMRSGIRSAAFHEGLSIIERDSAAAYFADMDSGAQVLVCSEIGSEGRNFQFSHHLVLFDLPLNPDLLEQRIGRLDRIGQQHEINIHVPYLESSAQEILFRWYNEGLSLFTQSCSAAKSIFDHCEQPLLAAIKAPNSDICELISQSKDYTAEIKAILASGRNPLLELNSCNTELAAELIEAIEEDENPAVFNDYTDALFEVFGLEQEYHSEGAQILRTSDHMENDYFPGFNNRDSVTVTSDRNLALVLEDMEFLNWEHPMINESMEAILDAELGNATITTMSVKGLNPGTLLLEVFHTATCMAPKHLQLNRYLPLSPVRQLLDKGGKNIAHVMSHQQLNDRCEHLKRATGQAVVKQTTEMIDQMMVFAENLAEKALEPLIEQAQERIITSLNIEIDRLTALRAVNPSIREEEIEFFRQQLAQGLDHIGKAIMQPQSIRLIVTT